MTDHIRILDDIAAGSQYEFSVITTFTAHLPFYEGVLLPRLRRAGCQLNVVLIDSRQCSRLLASGLGDAHRAGRDYALVPVSVPGAFHPKVALLAGGKAGTLFIGSHNLTLSGFSHNREVTTRFDLGPSADPHNALGYAAWELVRTYGSSVDVEIGRLFTRTAQLAPWLLKRPTAGHDGETRILATRPGQASLWKQLRPLIGERVRRVLVLGAFFDGDLSFIRRLSSDVEPRELVVAVDPDSVALPPKTGRRGLSRVRFVHAGTVGGGASRRLHAKLLLFELAGGEELLVAGSANPSAAAWLQPTETANVEAVVVRRGKGIGRPSLHVSLNGLWDRPELKEEDWERIEQTWERELERREEPSGAAALAFQTGDGFRVILSGKAATIRKVRLLDGIRELSTPRFEQTGNEVMVFAAPSDAAATTIVEMLLASGLLRAVPCHVDSLLLTAQSKSQRQLERAALTLETSSPEVEDFLRAVHRLVFEDLNEEAASGRHPVQPPEAGRSQDVDAAGGLETTIPERYHRSRAAKRLSADLAVILDLLLRALRGEREESTWRVTIAADSVALPDDIPTVVEEDLGYHLARLCRSKTGTLVRRLSERLAEPGAEAVVAVHQALAVLQTLFFLRTRESQLPWVPPGQHLVDASTFFDFVDACAGNLFFPSEGFADLALTKQGLETAPEIDRLAELTVWSAYLGEIDGRSVGELDLGAEDRRDDMLALANLLYAGARAPESAKRATQDLAGCLHPADLARAQRWLAFHRVWFRALSVAAAGHGRVLSREPAAGMFVSLKSDPRRRPLFVVDVRPESIAVAHPFAEGWFKRYSTQYTVTLDVQRPPLPAAPALRAFPVPPGRNDVQSSS